MASDDLLREAQDPTTSAARLGEIAQADRATWAAVAAHPNAYDGLLGWLGEHGDDSVRAAIASRSAAAAPPPPPPPPAAPVVPPAPPVEEPTQQLPIQPGPPSGPPSGPPTGMPTSPPAGPPSGPPSGPPVGPPTGYYPSYAAPASPPPSGGSGGSGKRVAIFAAAAVVLLALLGVGGFFAVSAVTGGDDDTKEASSETTSATSSPSESPSESVSESPSEDATDTGEDTGSGATDDFCTALDEQQDASMDMLSSMGDSPDFDKLKKQLDENAQVYQDLAADAPADIQGDLQTMADYFTEVQSLSSGNGDASDLSAMIQKFSKASQNVATYYYSNCL